MTKHTVFITRLIHDAGVALLTQAGVQVRAHLGRTGARHDELVRQAARHEAVICQLSDRVDEEVLAAAQGRCKIFATCAVGYDNIDVAAARRRGILLTNTPDVLTEATADLTWALLLAAARRLGEGERLVRAGAWSGWEMLQLLGVDVHGRTIGIVGAGRIGQAVARRATGFAMTVLYHDRTDRPELATMGARRLELSALLEQSDFVSLHVPLTAETRHMIDAKAIARMKRGAVLVNTSRGDVVDYNALADALRTGRLTAAGLDVYPREPKIPPALLELDNAVLLPHIGSATQHTRRRMAELAAQNVLAVLKGDAPLTPIP